MKFVLILTITLVSIAAIEGACTPGTSWKEDCNTCNCTPTGLAICTRKACRVQPVRLGREATCKPGDSWMDDCNQCSCNDNGHAICTKKSCKPQTINLGN